MSLTEPIPDPVLKDAGALYEPGPVRYVGNFVLSRESTKSVPVSLEEVFEPAIDTLVAEPAKALQFAKRFGKLSVNVALDRASSSFTLQSEGSFALANTAPIKTLKRYLPGNMFRAEERDARYAYLLFDEKPMTIELGLIQALHMLDYALVSEQFDGSMPLCKAIGYDQLAELQAKYPGVLARTYGNVRGLAEAPEILGTVVPTALLEKSGLELPGFEATAPPDRLRAISMPVGREPAAMVGITTAKRPHIGHGFLLTKAIAEAGEGGQVVVELNDRGPRVARAVSALAAQTGQTTAQASDAIVHAEITPSALEAAYQNRSGFDSADLPSDFALTANNALYERLLTRFAPEQTTITPIANSSRRMSELLRRLSYKSGVQLLFGDEGMMLFGKEKATVIAQYGEPTMAGIMGALATTYQLTLVDSPAPLDKNQLQIFEEAYMAVRQTEGMGLSIGFDVASGTGGEAPSLQAFLASLGPEDRDSAPRILRAVLNDAVFVRGAGKSLNPNYASARFLQQKLQNALGANLPELDIYKPFSFKNITREVSLSMTPYDGEATPAKGKLTRIELDALLATLPAITENLSPGLVGFGGTEAVIPKSLITQQDANFINKVRSADPKTVFMLARKSLIQDPDMVVRLTSSSLGKVMARMGYDVSEAVMFLQEIEKAGEIYVLT